MNPVALTIAGSDPSGGAGIQADLKTFHRFGVYGEAAITLLTVQNTLRVSQVVIMDPALVTAQIAAVLEDIPPTAAKLGALGDRAVVEAVAAIARLSFHFPLVVDPVMISKHGTYLMTADAREAMLQQIVPAAYLLTPNLHEAAALTNLEVKTPDDMKRAGEQLLKAGANNVLIKGGHLKGPALDLLFADGRIYEFCSDRIETPNTHGTGCTYSAAITAGLALGQSLVEAVKNGKDFITRAIRTHPGLGRGAGPVNHHA
ncbi:MAG TPA: bifunctional hydroxymethylpyrimidine kinase/phosphomethylpyrimidine kinase [Bryobacteraceae bacterium]|nr:bifunctional hydroxymethylpyrimidine kinase/phosphomethylpyrimidine kinase [Bryobacteraceae bacterium]